MTERVPRVEETEIPGVLLVTPPRFRDERGFFSETYNQRDLAALGIPIEFVQDNHARSAQRFTIRGLHFQAPPSAQAKLIRVARGAIHDVALDLRRGSPTRGRHVVRVLSADNWAQLLVPPGFAHGYCTLEPDTEVLYKTSAHYDPARDMGVRWDDPALGIDWPVTPDRAVVSDRDAALPLLADLPDFFPFEG